MTRTILITLCLLCFNGVEANLTESNSSCSVVNTSFKSGEKIVFHVYYSLAGIFVHAGNVSFTARLEQLNAKPVYHIVGDGYTLPSYDWIYRVRDRYESFLDTTTLLPKRFLRNVDEGGYKINQQVNFFHDQELAVSNEGRFKIPACTQDVLSEVYMARNIDFEKYKSGQQIPFDLFLDNKLYNVYIRYLGKETIKTKYGKFRCYKFRPLLLKGSLFEGGEKMTVWVTADQNKLPVRIESPIIVGSVKVDMMTYYNLRHPLTSFMGIK